MNEKDERLPDWVVLSREGIKNLKENWEGIHSDAQSDIRRGLEAEKIAKDRLRELTYLEETLGQELHHSIWNDPVVKISGESLFTVINSFRECSANIFGWSEMVSQNRQKNHDHFLTLTDTTSASGGSMVYGAAEIEKRIEVINPSYEPVYKLVKPLQVDSRQQSLDELKHILLSFDQRFLNMLEGSEYAPHKEGADYLSQAAHSMRDLFQQLIEYLAPAGAVKQQTWFIPTPGTPKEVSRKSRLKYLLCGSGSHLDNEAITQLDKVAEQAKGALELVISRAHSHDPQLTKDEVMLAIDHARFSLLEVLKCYKGRKIEGYRNNADNQKGKE